MSDSDALVFDTCVTEFIDFLLEIAKTTPSNNVVIGKQNILYGIMTKYKKLYTLSKDNPIHKKNYYSAWEQCRTSIIKPDSDYTDIITDILSKQISIVPSNGITYKLNTYLGACNTRASNSNDSDEQQFYNERYILLLLRVFYTCDIQQTVYKEDIIRHIRTIEEMLSLSPNETPSGGLSELVNYVSTKFGFNIPKNTTIIDVQKLKNSIDEIANDTRASGIVNNLKNKFSKISDKKDVMETIKNLADSLNTQEDPQELIDAINAKKE